MKKDLLYSLNLLICAALILVFLSSCSEEGSEAWQPKSKFTGEFLKRERDISSLLSDEFLVENIKTNYQSAYKVVFDRGSQMNYIVSLENTKDTVDRFLAYKKKDMWMLSRSKNDSLYTLQVIQLQDDVLLGWKDEFLQMLYIDELASKGTLGLDNTGAPFHYEADRKVILDHYEKILVKSQPRYRIARKADVEAEQEEAADTNANRQEQVEQGNYIEKIYPVPASDFMTIAMFVEGKYRVELVNKTGETKYKNEWVGPEFTLNLSDVPSDTYILLLKDAKLNLLDSRQIIVSK